MSTSIEWTDESWNPIRARLRSDPTVIGWHCEHASPGCEHCYSETRNRSGRCNMGTKLPYKPGHRKDVEIYIDEAQLLKPLSWRKGRKVFPCSMTDLFADFVTDEMLDRVFAVMILSHQHVFQVVTKRSARMREYLSRHRWHLWAAIGREIDPVRWRNLPPIMGGDCTPVPNVWLGVSVEDQQRADERIPDLLATPAALRLISAEPLLGPVNIGQWIPTCYECGATCGLRLDSIPDVERCTECGEECDQATEPEFSEGCPKCCGELEPVCPDCGHYMVYQHPDTTNLDWVVVGGESGKGARPMHPDWARSLRDQCAAAKVPFFFKQWGEFLDFEHLGGRWNSMSHRQQCNQQFVNGKAMIRVGKTRAGRLLDGVEHNGMPADV